MAIISSGFVNRKRIVEGDTLVMSVRIFSLLKTYKKNVIAPQTMKQKKLCFYPVQTGKRLCLEKGAKSKGEQSVTFEKLKQLEKVMHALNRQIFSLEKEMIEVKKKQ